MVHIAQCAQVIARNVAMGMCANINWASILALMGQVFHTHTSNLIDIRN